ncbi:hypothetical protein PG996_013301 [Apiospora saccharicola]|uniref:Uncharacterized protein n=1 Tax=Apiospora saccharicola TaxID=335842 RepID=A0ABR1U526_9PEZI
MSAKCAESRPARPPPKPLWKHDVVIIELGGNGGVGAASSAAAVTVTNKNTVTTLTTVTPAAGALVTAPPAAPALATGGAKAGLPAVNAGLNATTTGNVLGVGKQGTATGAPVKAPTAPPGGLPVTAGAAHIASPIGGLVGSVAMLFLAGAAGALVIA